MKKDTAKRLFLVALVLSMILVVAGCGDSEQVQLQLSKATAAEDYVEITPDNVLVWDKVYPPVTSVPMGWTATSGNVFVVVTAQVKNISEETISAASLSDYRVVAGDETFDNSITAILSEDDLTLDQNGELEAGDTREIYFITEIDKAAVSAETNIEFSFTAEEDADYQYVLSADTTKAVASYEELPEKENIDAENLTLSLSSVKFTKKIEPENPGYYYNYYQAADEDSRLLACTFDATNKRKTLVAASSMYGICAIYDGEVHIGSVFADDENKANITEYAEIDAGQRRRTYGIINLPKEAKDATCEIYVYVEGKYYRYVYQK